VQEEGAGHGGILPGPCGQPLPAVSWGVEVH
jgi:hypothetical protein